jgi:alkylhydroperoxidase family enzyme
MAYIEQIEEPDATGKLAGVYESARQRAGGVANIIKVMSRDCRSLAGSMQFYMSLMKAPNALSGAQREMLAAVVSNANDCYY